MFYILFTIGRTGSSLLINILNYFDEITFSGELYNLQLLTKMNSDAKITMTDIRIFDDRTLKKTGATSKNPLYFPRNTNYSKYFDNPKKFMNEFSELKTRLERLNYMMPQNKVSGCKILATSEAVKDFLRCKNMTKHFKIILLIRNNIPALRNSMKRAGFNSYKYVKLEEENEAYKKINDENENIYLLAYEDILNRNEKFKGLFKYLNVKYSDKNVLKGYGEICSYAPRRDLFKYN